MKSALHLTPIVFLIVSATATAYEFEAKSAPMALERSSIGTEMWDYHGIVEPTVAGRHQVTTTVKPEECRFYLTYEDEGRDHEALLRQARMVGEQLAGALSGIERAKVEFVPLNYSPEKSWHGIFVGEKAEIAVTFRVTIGLALDGENRFWENAEAVARALERITRAKEEGDWGRKLKQGRVAYAVESIEPTKAVLYSKVEEEVQALRKSLAAANETDRWEIPCKIEYGNPKTSRVTLEEVEVILPYRVEILPEQDLELEEED